VVFKEGVPYLKRTDEIVDIKHHQPVSFGLSVRKGLAKGFSVETGVTYTLLSSDVQTVVSDARIDQKLHYIGIPVRANWNFFDKDRFTLYVAAGGMVEKCVYGKLGNDKLTVNPLQFSVSGAVGAQFNATKHIGVYVEPGVALTMVPMCRRFVKILLSISIFRRGFALLIDKSVKSGFMYY
jgi:hypothetical protein